MGIGEGGQKKGGICVMLCKRVLQNNPNLCYWILTLLISFLYSRQRVIVADVEESFYVMEDRVPREARW